ncbi:MAG: MFS transporter [Actinobacteria bacterium]|nr:MFS transporter [Actinomycetota bacterium]
MSGTPGRGLQLAELADLLRRNAEFRRLFGATVVSFLGDWFSFVAVSGFVKEATGSDGAPALVFAAEVLPVFAFAPLAGVLADRLDRRRIMVGSDLLRIVPALVLIPAVTTGEVWLAYVAVASMSALAAFFQPVTAAVLPNLVDEEDLSLAQAALGSVWGTMLFVGAAVGGLVAGLLGRQTSFAINAATFALSALLVLRIRRPFRTGPVPARASVLVHLGEVRSLARDRKVVRALMTTKAGVGIGNGIVGLLPVYALDRFGAGDTGIGLLLAARGLGAFIGPYLGRGLARDEGRRQLLVIGGSIVAYAAAYALLPVTGTLVVAFLCVMVAHLGGGAQWVLSTHGLQVTTPDHIRGRVMSLDFGLATLAIGVSSLLAGGVAELFGLTVASLLMAGLALIYGVTWLAWTRDLWTGGDPFAVGESEVIRP